jgi:hypothetical protein
VRPSPPPQQTEPLFDSLVGAAKQRVRDRNPQGLDHVLGDARLRDFKPELEQFAVDAWRAPKRIFDAHPPDQRSAVALPVGATSNASSSESRLCANARASRAE